MPKAIEYLLIEILKTGRGSFTGFAHQFAHDYETIYTNVKASLEQSYKYSQIHETNARIFMVLCMSNLTIPSNTVLRIVHQVDIASVVNYLPAVAQRTLFDISNGSLFIGVFNIDIYTIILRHLEQDVKLTLWRRVCKAWESMVTTIQRQENVKYKRDLNTNMQPHTLSEIEDEYALIVSYPSPTTAKISLPFVLLDLLNESAKMIKPQNYPWFRWNHQIKDGLAYEDLDGLVEQCKVEAFNLLGIKKVSVEDFYVGGFGADAVKRLLIEMPKEHRYIKSAVQFIHSKVAEESRARVDLSNSYLKCILVTSVDYEQKYKKYLWANGFGISTGDATQSIDFLRVFKNGVIVFKQDKTIQKMQSKTREPAVIKKTLLTDMKRCVTDVEILFNEIIAAWKKENESEDVSSYKWVFIYQTPYPIPLSNNKKTYPDDPGTIYLDDIPNGCLLYVAENIDKLYPDSFVDRIKSHHVTLGFNDTLEDSREEGDIKGNSGEESNIKGNLGKKGGIKGNSGEKGANKANSRRRRGRR